MQPALPPTINQHQAQSNFNNYKQNQNNQTLNNPDDAVNSWKYYEEILEKAFCLKLSIWKSLILIIEVVEK